MATAQIIPIRVPSGTFYDITDHLQCLFDSRDMCEPEDRAALEAEIVVYLEAEIRKVDGIAGYLAHCDAQVKFASEEIQRLQQRKNTYENRHDALKQYVIRVMEDSGKKKIEGRTSTLMLRACPAAVLVTDEKQLPAEFVVSKTTTAPDKRAIKAAIEAAREVPGAELVSGMNTLVRK